MDTFLSILQVITGVMSIVVSIWLASRDKPKKSLPHCTEINKEGGDRITYPTLPGMLAKHTETSHIERCQPDLPSR